MATLSIPSVTIAQGSRVFGPFTMADRWEVIELELDLTNLPNGETVTLLVEFDAGTGFEVIVSRSWTGGPYRDKNGTNHPNLGVQRAQWSGSLPDRRGQGRLTVASTAASFLLLGGALTLRAR